VKLHFSLLKLRKQPFYAKNVIGKCQISKSRVAKPPPSDAHAPSSYAHALKSHVRCNRYTTSYPISSAHSYVFVGCSITLSSIYKFWKAWFLWKMSRRDEDSL